MSRDDGAPGRSVRPGSAMTTEDRERLKADAMRALSSVMDPELDEPITELGFVKNVSVEDGTVSVDLVMSTFWCSPNFVYMMLEDVRDTLSRLSGIQRVRITLEGHHDAPRINEAINAGRSFLECYGSEAQADIAALNRVFREKALRSRLHGMITATAKYGVPIDALLDMKLGDVELEGTRLLVRSEGRSIDLDPGDAGHVFRYLSFLKKLGRNGGPLVIWDLEGNPPDRTDLQAVLNRSRSARLSLSFNAELCKALLLARMGRERSEGLDSTGL